MRKITGIIAACILLTVCAAGCGDSSASVPENTVHSADDLPGKKIGTQLGTTGYIFALDIEDAKVEPYNKGADAVKALKEGDLDCVIIDDEPAKVFVEENPELQILRDPFVVEEYSIVYKKGNTELGFKLDDTLTALKKRGVINDIKSHWIGDDADYVPYQDLNASNKNGTIVMATNAEFPPYESMDQDNIVGIDVDIMTAICDELEMELVINNMDFDDILTAVENGDADVGVAGISITPERAKEVSFTQGYATSTQVIITRKDK